MITVVSKLKVRAVAMMSALTLSVVAVLSVPTFAFADDNQNANFRAWQELNNEALAVKDTYHYCLVAETDNAPMPAGANGNEYCFDLKGNSSHKFNIAPDASTPWKSVYSLRLVDTVPDGVVSSGEEYRYEVYSNGDDMVALSFGKEGNKLEDPGFTFAKVPDDRKTTPPPTTKTPPSTTLTPPPGRLTNTGAQISLGAAVVLLLGGAGFLLMRKGLSRRDVEE